MLDIAYHSSKQMANESVFKEKNIKSDSKGWDDWKSSEVKLI